MVKTLVSKTQVCQLLLESDSGYMLKDPKQQQEFFMTHHTYKHIELTGSSEVGTDGAINNAIEAASKTVKNMDWFEVVETRGHISNNRIKHWQVTLKVGFRIEN